MPKIIDHDQRRNQLATKAIDIFRTHGYRGLSMRSLCQHLEVSKSSLYHYFPSKEALFAHCGSLLMVPRVDEATPDSLELWLETIGNDFQGELRLLLEFASDPDLEMAERRRVLEASLGGFRQQLGRWLGAQDIDRAVEQLLGALTLGALLNRPIDYNTLARELISHKPRDF